MTRNYSLWWPGLNIGVSAWKGLNIPYKSTQIKKNLEYFSTSRTTSRRHSRWAASLATYDFKIIYCKDTLNGKADTISRRPDYKSPPSPSIPILSQPTSPPLISAPHSHQLPPTPYLAAAIFLSPDDPLLPKIGEAQAAYANLSTLIQDYLRRLDGESNPALPAGSPSGTSRD